MDLSMIARALVFAAGAAAAAPQSHAIVMRSAMKPASALPITLSGEIVTIDYLADPSADQGRFVIVNAGAADLVLTLAAAWLETGDGRRQLSGIELFDPATQQSGERPPDNQTLRIEAGAARQFGVSFAPVSYEPRFGETVAVGARIRVGGQVLEAKSPLKYVRRWPLGTQG